MFSIWVTVRYKHIAFPYISHLTVMSPFTHKPYIILHLCISVLCIWFPPCFQFSVSEKAGWQGWLGAVSMVTARLIFMCRKQTDESSELTHAHKCAALFFSVLLRPWMRKSMHNSSFLAEIAFSFCSLIRLAPWISSQFFLSSSPLPSFGVQAVHALESP